MAFLDGIGKKISQTSQDVMKKTKNFADSTKFSGMIVDEEKRINALYSQLGKAFYDLHKNDAEDALAELVGQINGAFDRIDQYNEQIAMINGAQKCPRCGAMVPEGGSFCNTCGAKMPPKVVAEPAEPAGPMVRCGNCGAQIPAGQRFCVYCGNEVTPQPQPEAQPEPQGKVCPECGRELPEQAAFCTGCGKPV